jgi:hypothetical protein
MEETVLTASNEATQTPQQVIEQEAVERYRESQKSLAEIGDELPDGYNEDGTPIEETPILGKFKSQEDLVKAYQELEKKLSSGNKEPVEKPAVIAEETTPIAGLNVTKYNEEFHTNGSLSDSSYKELENKGFSKDDVNRYIEGQKALVSQFTNTVYDTVGGQERYNQLTTWAADNLPQETINEYNQELAKGNTAKVTQLLEYMAFKAGSAAPQQPRRLEGQSTGDVGGIKPFSDKSEWQKATGNRLYGKDAKYTNLIDRRYLESRKKGLI